MLNFMLTFVIGIVILAIFSVIFFVKFKKNMKFSIIMIAWAVVELGAAHCMLFLSEGWVLLSLGSALIFAVALIVEDYKEEYKGKFKRNILFFIFFFVIGIEFSIAALIPAIIIDFFDDYTHIVEYNYEITIADDNVDVDFDCENVPECAYGYIQEKISEMKSNDLNFYEGKVKVQYKCAFPKYREMHDTECTCNENGICDKCKEYISNSKVIS